MGKGQPPNMIRASFRRSGLWLALLAVPGCSLDYYLGVSAGALGSVFRSRPITGALADPTVDELTKTKLRFVQEVRQFGIDVIGQTAGGAYTLYDDDSDVTAGGPVGYSLSASAKDGFTEYLWQYPFIGAAPYRGFFNRDEATRERDRLKAEGYDTYLGIIAGFSTLGLLPDPIRASQLKSDEPDLAKLLLHELTHSTVYKTGDTSFNETLAEFSGRTAARQFFVARRGADSEATAAALRRYDDEDVVDEFIGAVYDQLSAYYAQPLSREEKIAGRQAQFDAVAGRFDTDYRPRLYDPDRYRNAAELTLNNAIIQGAARYRGNLSAYRDVLDRVGDDFKAAWPIFREAAKQGDSFAFLKAWVARHDAGGKR